MANLTCVVIPFMMMGSFALPERVESIDPAQAAAARGGLVVQIGWGEGMSDSALLALQSCLVQVLERQLVAREQRDILQHVAMAGRSLRRILEEFLGAVTLPPASDGATTR